MKELLRHFLSRFCFHAVSSQQASAPAARWAAAGRNPAGLTRQIEVHGHVKTCTSAVKISTQRRIEKNSDKRGRVGQLLWEGDAADQAKMKGIANETVLVG